MPATREEKKEWWFANKESIEAEANKRKEDRKVEIQSKKGFSLPDKSFRLIYLLLKSIKKVETNNPNGSVDIIYSHKPVGSLVTKLVTEGPFDRMEFSWSAVHTPEDKFDRSEGRTKALEHLSSKPIVVKGPKGINPFFLKVCATQYLAGVPFSYPQVELIEEDGRIIPKNVRLVAKQWLKSKSDKINS